MLTLGSPRSRVPGGGGSNDDCYDLVAIDIMGHELSTGLLVNCEV